jgi:hypothetical protein
MTYADLLIISVAVTLVAYYLALIGIWSHTLDPGATLTLLLAPYWTIVGAVPVLLRKRDSSGAQYSYLETRLFELYPDRTYALVLLTYAGFLLIGILIVALTSRGVDQFDQARGTDTWNSRAAEFSHGLLLTWLSFASLLKFAVVVKLIGSASSTSIYVATRVVRGDNASLIRLYQYLSIAVSYPLATGFVLWLSFPAARRKYAFWMRRTISVIYALFLLSVLAENALFGNRATLLVMMGAIAAGWFRWRYMTAPLAERSGLRRRFGAATGGGLVALGTIGISRGGGLSSPSAVVGSLWLNLQRVGHVVLQEVASSEKLAAHMSLYTVIERNPAPMPLATDSYVAYVNLVHAPVDQTFTLHYVTAWWLHLGPLGIIGAILSFGIVVGLVQRVAASIASPLRAGACLAAATLPAAGIPVVLLRSGPEALRGVIVELILIPAIILTPCFIFGHRRITLGSS